MLARRVADAPQLVEIPDEPAACGSACPRPARASSAGRAGGPADCGAARNSSAVKSPSAPISVNWTPALAAPAPGLVPHGVGLHADDHVVARAAVELQRELVGHRPGRDEQRRLLAQQRGDALLERDDRRVLAVLVVAHLGLGDRAAHRIRRPRDRVGPEIDHADGSSSSLPMVRRPWRSSCARRTSDSGYVSPSTTRSSPRATRSKRSCSGGPNCDGSRSECTSQ